MPNRIPLQPAASPVDQFYLPNVKKPAQTNSLLQLAGALAQVRPELTQVLESRAQAWVDRGPAIGNAEIERLGLQNKQQLKDAVDKGLIREGDNPWVMLAVKQGVARVEAESAASEMLDSYYKDGWATKDSLAEVQGFATQFMHARFQDRDPDELKVIAPVAEQAIQRLSSMHVQQRSEERVQEAQLTVQTLTEKYAQDLKTVTDPNQRAAVLAQYEQALAPFKNTLTWPKMNAARLEGAKAAALAVKDVSVYDDLVNSIQTPGGSYGNTAEAKLNREELLSNIQAQEDREYARQDRLEKHANEQILQVYLKSYQNQLNEARKTNPSAGPNDIGWSINAIESWDLPEDVKDDLWGRIFNRLQAKEASKGVDRKQAFDNALNLLKDKKTTITVADIDSISTKTGIDAAQQHDLLGIADAFNRFRDQDTQEGTDAVIQLRQQPGGPTLSDLKSLRDRGLISNPTFLQEAERVTQGRSGLPIGFGEVLRADSENLGHMVLTSLNTQGLTSEQWSQQDFSGFVTAQQRAQDIQDRMNEEFFSILDTDPDHSYAHLRDVKNQIRDRLIKDFKDATAPTAAVPAEKPKTLMENLASQSSAAAGNLINVDEILKNSTNLAKAHEVQKFNTDWDSMIQSVKATGIPLTPEDKGQLFADSYRPANTVGTLFSGPDHVGVAAELIHLDQAYYTNNWKSILIGNESDQEFYATRQTETQAHVITQRQAEEKLLGTFMDQALEALKQSASGQPLTYRQKKQILNADLYRRRVSDAIMAGGFEVGEAKQRFGDDAWAKVPLFVGNAQLNKYGVNVAAQFGIKPGTPEFDQFLAKQHNFLANQAQYFNR